MLQRPSWSASRSRAVGAPDTLSGDEVSGRRGARHQAVLSLNPRLRHHDAGVMQRMETVGGPRNSDLDAIASTHDEEHSMVTVTDRAVVQQLTDAEMQARLRQLVGSVGMPLSELKRRGANYELDAEQRSALADIEAMEWMLNRA